MSSPLIEKFTSRRAVIGVIGLGYVGLPLVQRFLDSGFQVLGLDVDQAKVDCLLAGQSYIEHIPGAPLKAYLDRQQFLPTTDFSHVRDADALILCVPTPLTRHREPDLTYVLGSLESLLPHIRAGQVLALESTTYPGTTEEELRPRLAAKGFTVGQDVFLVYSPEREDPGNQHFCTRSIPKVVGGSTPACLEVGVAMYGQIIDTVVPVSSTQVAEMTKILENTFRSVNIALVNELKLLAERMGFDIFEVIRAASTKPFGYMPFYPGPGLGGHCIPIDPFYLTWKAREYGLATKFIELAGEMNTSMPDYVVSRCMYALNQSGTALKNARILVLGLAYKKNVDDIRESPSVVLLDKLQRQGAVVAYSDPHVPVFPKTRHYRFDLESLPLSPETLTDQDLVLIATAHDRFDWDLVRAHSRLILDCRGVFAADDQQVFRA